MLAMRKPNRNQVFAYIEQEDTPRSLAFQLDLLREVGFSRVEVLRKNSCFVAFGALEAKTECTSNNVPYALKERSDQGK
jgi:hypothetical protein